ncbi:MAG: MFS transporter [Alphaproteobacteria bacterium]
MSRATNESARTAGTASQRWLGLAAVFAAGAIVTMLSGLVWPLLSFRLEAMGYSGGAIGLSTAAQALAIILIAPLAPRLARRVGVVRLMLVAVVGAAVVLAAMAAWPSYGAWLVLRFALGIAIEILFVLGDAWVVQMAPDHARGRVVGLYAAFGFLGFAGGPLIIDAVGSRGATPFLAGIGCIALAGLPLWLARRAGPVLGPPGSGNLAGYLRATPTIMLAGAMYGFIDVMVLALFPVYALRSGLEEGAIARLITMAVLGSIAFQVVIGWLCDRVSPYRVLAGCTLSALGCVLALPFTIGTTMLVLVVLVLWGGAMGGFFTVGMVLMGQRYTGADLIGASGMFAVMFGLGSMVGPVAGGAAMDLWDPHGMVAVVALVCASYLIVLGFSRARRMML